MHVCGSCIVLFTTVVVDSHTDFVNGNSNLEVKGREVELKGK